jgi:hypothetical protein
MQTITIDILNNKAVRLLQDLELLQLIRLHKEKKATEAKTDWSAKYKGAMTKQSLSDIDQQINTLREGWD